VADTDPTIVIFTTIVADGRETVRISHVYQFKAKTADVVEGAVDSLFQMLTSPELKERMSTGTKVFDALYLGYNRVMDAKIVPATVEKASRQNAFVRESMDADRVSKKQRRTSIQSATLVQDDYGTAVVCDVPVTCLCAVPADPPTRWPWPCSGVCPAFRPTSTLRFARHCAKSCLATSTHSWPPRFTPNPLSARSALSGALAPLCHRPLSQWQDAPHVATHFSKLIPRAVQATLSALPFAPAIAGRASGGCGGEQTVNSDY
jgi:hypothetical protein